MKGFTPLLLGIFATLAFSWVGLAFIPNLQIGHLEPQSDEEGTDIYPMPKSGMAARGHQVYVANGCFYCHSQQVRAERKWGKRRSAPRDYIFERPVEIGRMRLGPDLSNIGARAPAEEETAAVSPSPASSAPPANASPAPSAGAVANASPAAAASASPASANTTPPAANASPAAASSSPAPSAPSVAAASPTASVAASPAATQSSGSPAPYSAAWHHEHLYAPRSVNDESNMPAYKFLYTKRSIGGQPSAEALKLSGADAPAPGFEIVPNYDAQCLVAYLMSLDQSHPLKEIKSAAAPATSPAASPAAAKK